MLDIDDWMLSCNKQINQFRNSQFTSFWEKLFNNEFTEGGSEPSIDGSEEGGKTDNGKNLDDNQIEDDENLIKFKT